MTQTPSLPLFDNAQAWYGPDLARHTDWIHQLDEAECAEIAASARRAAAGKVDLVRMTRADFPLPTLVVDDAQRFGPV